MIACECAVCLSTDPKNKRFRSSIYVESEGFRLVVDTTPDFRSQCLRARIQGLDAILYTHEHSDHILGLDDLRRFCSIQDQRIPAYASEKVIAYIHRMFPYAVEKPPPYKGLPEIDVHEIRGPFQLGPFMLTPYQLPHGRTQSLGFRFSDQHGPRFAYLTDCKEVAPEIRRELKGIPLLILDALRKTPHPTHLSVSEALEVVSEIQPGQTFFTHIAHELDHEAMNAELPGQVRLAYDGLQVEL
jgi:phosphoribosyl 1,2-cyclic phosphate phosphodiesterase